MIDLNEWLIRCEKFFNDHPNEYVRTSMSQINEMFDLHNDRLSPKENGRYCSKCCGRVYRRLKQHYEKLKNTNE